MNEYTEVSGLEDLDGMLDDVELGSFLGKLVKGIGKGVKAVGKVALPVAKLIPGVGNVVSGAETAINIGAGAAKMLKKKGGGAAPAPVKLSTSATPAAVQAAVKASKVATQATPKKPVVVNKPVAASKPSIPVKQAADIKAPTVIVQAAPLDIGRIVTAFSGSVSPKLNAIASLLQNQNMQAKAQAEHNQRAKDLEFKTQLMAKLSTMG